MRRAEQVWQFVRDLLQVGQESVLLTVVDASAGSPGRAGFSLALASDGRCVGTIGGGRMEYALVRASAEALRHGVATHDLRTLVHEPNPTRGEPSGLICGGTETVCVHPLGPADLGVVTRICDALAHRRPATLMLTPEGAVFRPGDPVGRAGLRWESDTHWSYSQRLGPDHTALVVGGGHVGAALARVLTTLDLDVLVVDDRENIAMTGGAVADGAATQYLTQVADFSELADAVAEPESTYAVVVTSSMATDTVAMRSLLPLRLPFLGLMGTSHKIQRILRALDDSEREEFRRQWVHAPVGLPIGSHSPEEIAVSVAAQIISVRSGSAPYEAARAASQP